jgi:tetratricopeptide (TPR) repeat protein
MRREEGDCATDVSSAAGGEAPDEPEGSPYDWYRRAVGLLESGSPDAAATLFARLREIDPASNSILEGLARALFDCRRFGEAAEAFSDLADRSPAEDYAHYGLGMCLWRLQRFPHARDELAMAFVMRPGRAGYASALSQVRATLRARALGGLPLEGPIST